MYAVSVHMASPADQIPLINPFVEWCSRSDQLAMIVEPANYRDPITTAQRLNERPSTDDVLFRQPAHDSGYGSMGPQETFDEDEPPCPDGEPQCRTQYAEDETDYFPGNTCLSELDSFFLMGGGSLDASLEYEVDSDPFANLD